MGKMWVLTENRVGLNGYDKKLRSNVSNSGALVARWRMLTDFCPLTSARVAPMFFFILIVSLKICVLSVREISAICNGVSRASSPSAPAAFSLSCFYDTGGRV